MKTEYQKIYGPAVEALMGLNKPSASSAEATPKTAGPLASLRCDALVGPLAKRYWKAPFRYEAEGTMIWDARGERTLDVRGWGRLTGKGCGALGLTEDEAAKAQDQFGESVVRVLNASWPNNASATPRCISKPATPTPPAI